MRTAIIFELMYCKCRIMNIWKGDEIPFMGWKYNNCSGSKHMFIDIGK